MGRTQASTPSQMALQGPEAEPLKLIVGLDGSIRAGEALVAARILAARYDAEVSAIALRGERPEVQQRIEQQLKANRFDAIVVEPVSNRVEMVDRLLCAAERGTTPTLSAFGRWSNPGRLFGVLGDLVRSNIDQVLAVGPNVNPMHWKSTGPIIESVDGVCRIEPLIEASLSFVDAATPKIIIAHVQAGANGNDTYAANRIAAKFGECFALPVEFAVMTASSVSSHIGQFARGEQASLIVARSWHRSITQRPNSASTSLSLAAEAPCPVLIVN